MWRTSLVLCGLGMPFHFKTSIQTEINNSRSLQASLQAADGCRGLLARGCQGLPPLAWCLSISSICPDSFVPDPGDLFCHDNGVFKRWVHVRASAKSIPSKENSTLKLVTWDLLQVCRHPDPWHPFNQITSTWVSPVTYTQNSDSLVISTRIIRQYGFLRNSRSAHQVLCSA